MQLKVEVGPESDNRNCQESESDDGTSDSTALVQTSFSNSSESQPVSLHDTTGRLRSGKCYLRSFPHSSFSTSAPNCTAMSTAPQRYFLSNRLHSHNQWFPTYLIRSLVFLGFLFSPVNHQYPLLTSLLLRLQFAVLLVRLIYLICLALLRPKCPIFGPNFASIMFPALQALDAIAVPITSCSHPCFAQTGPLHPINSDCLVLYIFCLCVFFLFHSCLCLIFAFICCNVHFMSTPRSAMQWYIIPQIFLQQRFNASMLFLPSAFAAASHKPLFNLFVCEQTRSP